LQNPWTKKMNDCIFCKIISQEIPSEIVYEDENTLAFLDINPINLGHTLVIPKQHHENIFDVPEEILNNTMKVLQKVARSVDEISDGINVGQNNRPAAGQIVNHIHFHVIPRFEKDGLRSWPGKKYGEAEIKETLGKIRKNLE